MRIQVTGVEEAARNSETFAEFGNPVSDSLAKRLKEDGFSVPRTWASFCIKWIVCQWLLGRPPEQIRSKVEPFVERGLQMQTMTSQTEWRALHDLFLLHCAVFACPKALIEKLAVHVVDSSGFNGRKPEEKLGELYASAWCGMLKYWILGDRDKAVHESELIWGAYQDSSFRAAAKPLVTPWLKSDWKAFSKAQQKDFEKRWQGIERDLRNAGEDSQSFRMQRFPIEQRWSWAHCGLALLAHRQGAELATDDFWLPAHALKVADI